jgi:anaphase-promoting complex subunit 7
MERPSGVAAAAAGDVPAAVRAFERAHSMDPHGVDGMDIYAALLCEHDGDESDENDATREEYGEKVGFGVLSSVAFAPARREPSARLAALVNDLMAADAESPQAWAAAATYWAAKREPHKALAHAERAIRLDDRRADAHLVKGTLCLRLGRNDAAVGAFKRAAALEPSRTYAHAGIVAAYSLTGRYKEALAAAKEATRLAPASAPAASLVGDAHRKSPIEGSSDKARRAYEASLKLDPSDAGVAMALSDVHADAGRHDTAAGVLRRHLERHAPADVAVAVALRCKLGAVLAASKLLADALGAYQQALTLSPGSEEAARGMTRVERMLKGQDPDGDDDDDAEDEDDMEDSEDAEENGADDDDL